MIAPYRGKMPVTGSPCFIADSAVIVGDVSIDERCSVWPGAVLRGDVNSIAVGRGTNLQDNCVVHVDREHGVKIGDCVTVGHGATVHGCTVGDGALIGISATVLDGAEIGEWSIVGAGAVVLSGSKIPPRSMVLGVPAKVVRSLTDDEVAALREHAAGYWELAEGYM